MAHTRSNDEIVSLLPSWVAQASEDFPAWLILTCPREDCGLPHMVRKNDWFAPKLTRGGTLIVGRACPYCFKAARLPARRGVRYNHTSEPKRKGARK